MTDKQKGLRRWKFSTNFIPCMKESDDGTYWSCNDVKSVLRKRWKKLNQAHDEWDINDEYGAAMCGGIEELEEIYLELIGKELK